MYYIKNDTESMREIMLPNQIKRINRYDFIEVVTKFLETDMKILVLNLKDTNVIDSAGLGFLLIAREKVANTEKSLILRNPTKHVKKMFDVLNFDSIFTIEDN